MRNELHDRFQHLLIDEYQDTNRAQYVLVKLLAGKRGNIMAVGDEDQSIYKFRGADINNILNFERDFPGARIIKLEQNYRSTGNILDAATGVVSNNIARKGKTLFTSGGKGDPVRIVTCSNEREEAQFVLEKISSLRSKYKLTDFAVLFRTNAQSRPFEEELLRANLPYSVVGGVKFYERAEIKDILSFVRLAIAAARHAVDRARDQRPVARHRRHDRDRAHRAGRRRRTCRSGRSSKAISRSSRRARRRRCASSARSCTTSSARRRIRSPSSSTTCCCAPATGACCRSRATCRTSRACENLEELLNSAREYYGAEPAAPRSADYLDSLTLMSDLDRYESQKGVTLMTLHSAKGLEFKVVFLAGMEEGILPHSQSLGGARTISRRSGASATSA